MKIFVNMFDLKTHFNHTNCQGIIREANSTLLYGLGVLFKEMIVKG